MIWTLLLVLSLVPIVWAFAPGGMDVDSVSLFQEAVEKSFKTAYSPVVSGIWHLLGANAATLIFTLCLTLGVFAFFTYKIYSLAGLKHSSACLLAIATCYTPPILGPLSSQSRDTWVAVLFLGATYLTILHHTRPRLTITAIRGLVLAAGVLVRQDFLPIAGLFLLVDFLLATGQSIHHRACDLALGGFVMIGAWLTIGWTTIQMEHTEATYPEQVLYLYDLDDLSVHSGTILIPPPFADNIDLETLKRHYNPVTCLHCFWSEPANEMIHFSQKKNDISTLRNKWLLEIYHHPGLYLEHRARIFEVYLITMSDGYQVGIAPNPYGLTEYHLTSYHALIRYIRVFRHTWFPLHLVSILGSLVAAAWLLRNGRSTPINSALLVSLACGFCYQLLFAFIATAPYYRYGFAGMVIFWIALYVILADLVGATKTYGRLVQSPT